MKNVRNENQKKSQHIRYDLQFTSFAMGNKCKSYVNVKCLSRNNPSIIFLAINNLQFRTIVLVYTYNAVGICYFKTNCRTLLTEAEFMNVQFSLRFLGISFKSLLLKGEWSKIR
jgi:hypothetical protein